MTVDSAQLCTTKIMVQNRLVLEPPFCGFVTATFLFTWHNIYNFYSRSSKGLSVYNCNCIMERLLDIQLKVWNHTRWRNNGTTHIDDTFRRTFSWKKKKSKGRDISYELFMYLSHTKLCKHIILCQAMAYSIDHVEISKQPLHINSSGLYMQIVKLHNLIISHLISLYLQARKMDSWALHVFCLHASDSNDHKNEMCCK